MKKIYPIYPSVKSSLAKSAEIQNGDQYNLLIYTYIEVNGCFMYVQEFVHVYESGNFYEMIGAAYSRFHRKVRLEIEKHDKNNGRQEHTK